MAQRFKQKANTKFEFNHDFIAVVDTDLRSAEISNSASTQWNAYLPKSATEIRQRNQASVVFQERVTKYRKSVLSYVLMGRARNEM